MALVKNYNDYLSMCDENLNKLDAVLETVNGKLDDLNVQLKDLRTSVRNTAKSIPQDLDVNNPEEYVWFDDISDAQAERCYDAWDKVAELSSQCSKLIRHINRVIDRLDSTEI